MVLLFFPMLRALVLYINYATSLLFVVVSTSICLPTYIADFVIWAPWCRIYYSYDGWISFTGLIHFRFKN